MLRLSPAFAVRWLGRKAPFLSGSGLAAGVRVMPAVFGFSCTPAAFRLALERMRAVT